MGRPFKVVYQYRSDFGEPWKRRVVRDLSKSQADALADDLKTEVHSRRVRVLGPGEED